MAGVKGHKQPKKHLSFTALLEGLQSAFERIIDSRDIDKVKYSLPNAYKCFFAMFFFQDKSLLEFQKQLKKRYRRHNLETVYNIKEIPEDTQLRDIVDTHSNEPIIPVFKDYFSRLQRNKYLNEFQFINGSYLITIDGSVYFSSNKIQCEQCLTKAHANGTTTYQHQIVQATLVHPDKRQVIPLAPEFIKNSDGTDKQDCEINAGKRLISRIRRDHPYLRIVLTADSLYAKQPFIEDVKKLGYSYIFTAKEKDHKSLYAEIDGFRRTKLFDSKTVRQKNRTYLYEWVNDIDLNANKTSLKVNFVRLAIADSKGKITYKSAWITDIEITKDNVTEIVRGGRARWKIENECFNTLKNHGYHINHNFGHGKKYLSETLFLLNLLAFFFHQIFMLSDALYQAARATCSAQVEYWNTIRVAFKLIVFKSWEDLLIRINSPPQTE